MEMMKSNAPYSSARRAANQQVASGGAFDQLKYLVTGRGRQTNPGINQEPANRAANVLRNTSSTGRTAVDNVRKARNRTADYLNSIGE
jgi:hypothetical protein